MIGLTPVLRRRSGTCGQAQSAKPHDPATSFVIIAFSFYLRYLRPTHPEDIQRKCGMSSLFQRYQ